MFRGDSHCLLIRRDGELLPPTSAEVREDGVAIEVCPISTLGMRGALRGRAAASTDRDLSESGTAIGLPIS